mmetsp:Transcript_9356/g.25210  ORF Transcript_9356/g.25210 Transcript_9356/m.25210 type:complete len:259 (-) Transcript_9356:2876-3652(-)
MVSSTSTSSSLSPSLASPLASSLSSPPSPSFWLFSPASCLLASSPSVAFTPSLPSSCPTPSAPPPLPAVPSATRLPWKPPSLSLRRLAAGAQGRGALGGSDGLSFWALKLRRLTDPWPAVDSRFAGGVTLLPGVLWRRKLPVKRALGVPPALLAMDSLMRCRSSASSWRTVFTDSSRIASRSTSSLPKSSVAMREPMRSLPCGSMPYSLGMTAMASWRDTTYSSRRSRFKWSLWLASYLALSYISGILEMSNVPFFSL